MHNIKTNLVAYLVLFTVIQPENFYLLPIKLGFLAQKRPNLVQNMHFWSFWAKYWHFLPISSHARPKNNANKVPRWVFRYVGNKTFDFSSKKKDFLPKNDQIWPKTGIFGQFGSVGGCGARAVSRKTPIYFIIYEIFDVDKILDWLLV